MPIDAPAVDLRIEAGDWPSRRSLLVLSRRAIGAAAGSVRMRPASEVSLLFTDDAHMRPLNRDWRRKDRSTNVLSFPGSPPDKGLYGPLLGDIVLAFETVSREAEEQGTALRDHTTHLIVHGFLHLFGFDHQHDTQAELMEGLETAILTSLGIADPYADPAYPLVENRAKARSRKSRARK